MSPHIRLLFAVLLATVAAVPALAAPKKPQPNLTVSSEVMPVEPSVGDSFNPDDEMTAGTEKDAEQSLFDALRFAYDNNPSIRAGRAELMAVQENLPQAQSGWKPVADAGVGVTKTWVNSPGAGDGSTAKDLSLSLNQPLYRGGRTVAAIESAKNIIMAQRSFLNATEQTIMLQVVTAYMNVLRDQSLLNLAENNKEVIGKQLDASKARFEVGDVTRTDVAQSQARMADAESRRIAALGNLRSSLAVYQQIVGMPPGHLTFPKMTLPIPATLDEAVVSAENNNPSIIAAQYLHRASQKDIDTVFGELLPSVAVVGSVDHTIDPSPGLTNRQTVSAIGVAATIPLYDAGSVRSRVRQAKSLSSQRLVQIEDAQRAAREQTVSNWETLAATVAEIQSRKSQVEANTVAREGVHKEAELGTRTILDALDADQELLLSRSALVTARRDEIVARFTLATALGLLTSDVLGFPELGRDYNQHLNEITGKVFDTTTRYHAEPAATAPQDAVKH